VRVHPNDNRREKKETDEHEVSRRPHRALGAQAEKRFKREGVSEKPQHATHIAGGVKKIRVAGIAVRGSC
jgi:hypothetical protein